MPSRTQTFHDYYWGKGAKSAPSFRADINKLVPADRKRVAKDDPKDVVLLLPLLFKSGKSSFLKGRRRDQFLVSLYFTVLIDQGMHCYYREYHGKYDKLTIPPKICTTVDNVYPSYLFQSDYGWPRWTKSRRALFKEAEEVFRHGFLVFAAEHFPRLNAHQAWRKFARHLPPEALE